MEFLTTAKSYPPPSSMVPTVSVKELLATKGSEVWSVAPETLVYDAIQVMTDRRVGALLVMNGGRLVGMFSERDYLRRVILQDRTSKSTRVGDIMTSDVTTVNPRGWRARRTRSRRMPSAL